VTNNPACSALCFKWSDVHSVSKNKVSNFLQWLYQLLSDFEKWPSRWITSGIWTSRLTAAWRQLPLTATAILCNSMDDNPWSVKPTMTRLVPNSWCLTGPRQQPTVTVASVLSKFLLSLSLSTIVILFTSESEIGAGDFAVATILKSTSQPLHEYWLLQDRILVVTHMLMLRTVPHSDCYNYPEHQTDV